jgi:nucleotide-binding universal stress UspA family protein
MKTIIISDVKSESDTVIPYGLHLAKALEAETEVLHIIDPRSVQGKYSAFSDSQSVTPGRKLSREEILTREKNEAEKKLDDLLSREASRLNYPLRVNSVVEESKVEEALEKRTKEKKPAVFVISSEPDKMIFDSKAEIINIIKNSGAMAFVVPPGTKFRPFQKVLLPIDFDSENVDELKEIKFFIDHFNPFVNVVSVTRKKDYIDTELKIKSWTKNAKNAFLPEKVKANTLKGKDFAETLIRYSSRNEPDLIILLQKKQNVLKKFIKNNAFEKILKNVTVPVFFHCHK